MSRVVQSGPQNAWLPPHHGHFNCRTCPQRSSYPSENLKDRDFVYLAFYLNQTCLFRLK